MNTLVRCKSVLLGCALLLGSQDAGAQDWPQWRGPGRDNKVLGFKAPKAWPRQLTEKWNVNVGIGESSPVLVGDRLFVLGRQGDDEVTTCLDAGSGKVLWQDRNATPAVTGAAARFPGTRSTPAVADGKVCTLSVTGVVSCLDAATGAVVWRKDTRSRPMFFTSTSPIIVDGKCIVYVGALTAFDLASGNVRWEWTGGKTPYGSPVLMTAHGTKQLVTSAFGSIVGVSVDDGKLLWKFDYGGGAYQGTYMTPIVDGATVIYSAPGGKGGGGSSVTFKIDKKADGFVAVELWRKSQAPYQYNTPVLRDGLVFGLSSGRNFFCMDARSGDVLWTDNTRRGEAGAVLDAGSVMLALTGDAELIAFEPSAKAYTEVAKYQVSATPGLAYPIIAGNRVYVKGKDALTLWTLD